MTFENTTGNLNTVLAIIVSSFFYLHFGRVLKTIYLAQVSNVQSCLACNSYVSSFYRLLLNLEVGDNIGVYSQGRSSVPPKDLLMNWLFEK